MRGGGLTISSSFVRSSASPLAASDLASAMLQLPADDLGGCCCVPRVRPNRSRPLCRVRRVLRRVAPRPSQRLRVQGRHHLRVSPATLSLSVQAYILQQLTLSCACGVACGCSEGRRGGKSISTKAIVDSALKQCPLVEHVLVLKGTGGKVNWTEGRDAWWHEETAKVPSVCPVEIMASEDPLFILYVGGTNVCTRHSEDVADTS